MVTQTQRILLALSFAFVIGSAMTAHEVSVHRRITEAAVDLLATTLNEKSPNAVDDVCRATLKDLVGLGVEAEDAFFEGLQPLVGRFYFHFEPKLQDNPTATLFGVPTLNVLVEANCGSSFWGHFGQACEAKYFGPDWPNVFVPALKTKLLDNTFTYQYVINRLKAYPPGSLEHREGLVALGHYLHLLQDLTSPAHTRQDGHPHAAGEYPFNLLGDPSLFEASNIYSPIPPVTKSLEDISNPLAAFENLRAWTRTRHWSEKNTLKDPLDVPQTTSEAGGYALSGGRKIAHWDSIGRKWTINARIAREQFSELAPEAVRYTASMIKYIIDKEGVSLCALPPTRYRAVMAPKSPITGGVGTPPCSNGGGFCNNSSINASGAILLKFYRPPAYGGGDEGWDYYIWGKSGLDVVPLGRSPSKPHVSSSSEHRLDDDGRVLFQTTDWPVYLWDRTGIRDLRDVLGTPAGTPPFHPSLGFSSAGHAVTVIELANRVYRIFRWDGVALRDLGFGPPESMSWPGAINKRGQVCGLGGGHLMFWDGEKVIDLGSGQGGIPESRMTCTDLNENGWAVGAASARGLDGTIRNVPMLWRGGMDFVNLGTLAIENPSSVAGAINDGGVVVGFSASTTSRQSHGFVWSSGTMRDLNDLIDSGLEAGWIIESAADINNAGQIVVVAYKEGVGRHTFRLDPIR